MKQTLFIAAAILILFSPNNMFCQSEEVVDLTEYFKGVNGSFVLYDYNNDKYIRHNPDLCAEQFTPASTFKILNSMIGLETKAIEDENEMFKWDGTEYRIMKDWNRNHNLATGIKYSVVWLYRELARRIGEEKMKKFVTEVDYGNNDISGGLDKFWLGSSIKISANEQVEFLKKFHENKLPFSQETMDVVKSIMTGEDGENYQLRAKTGLSYITEEYFIGWYVGFVYGEDNTYVFALNLFGDDVDLVRKGRIEITKAIMKHLDIVR